MEKLIFPTLFAFLTQSALADTPPPVALLSPANQAPESALPMPSQAPSNHEAVPAVWNDYAKVESMAQNGQATEALALLETRLTQAPNDAKASYLKGLILMQLGRRENAEAWFLSMRQQFPKLPQPYNALAVIYQAQGKLIEAELILRELSQAHPEQKNVHRNRGEIYLQLAQSAFEKAHQQNPDDAMINERLEALSKLLPKDK
ncbi:MAG: tetratricopeptide repeat protein [Cardiobacteriaceae bacterium]|nr:tetratricopeptide repeat protein [Cardiobacteriaceae bacterium]